MKKILSLIFLIILFLILLKTIKPAQKPVNTVSNIAKIKLALDWTPNTNHTGIYIAQNQKYFADEGLEVELLPFSSNASPDVLVANDKADIGISSTEWIVADRALGAPVVSIAAIISKNTSALIALDSSPVSRPRDLSGKIYGGFGAPYEEAVVGEIIKKDGGKPNIKNISLDIEALNALESKKIDFVWVYLGWDVIKAKKDGYKLKIFPITEYGIADYYSPVFITSPKYIKENKETLKKFMKALSRGYDFAVNNPEKSAEILINSVPKGTFADVSLVYESQKYLSPLYKPQNAKWGYQESEKWQIFPRFMLSAGSIKDDKGKAVTEMDFNSLYTNEFLPSN